MDDHRALQLDGTWLQVLGLGWVRNNPTLSGSSWVVSDHHLLPIGCVQQQLYDPLLPAMITSLCGGVCTVLWGGCGPWKECSMQLPPYQPHRQEVVEDLACWQGAWGAGRSHQAKAQRRGSSIDTGWEEVLGLKTTRYFPVRFGSGSSLKIGPKQISSWLGCPS